ncbi:MAG: TIGR04076 family protein, partial [Deltaproteobacteria bacterium]|nr:TIGR04076 family protein [Deltaproteobacteria bacterium]
MMALQSMVPVFLVMQRENLDKDDWASKSGQIFVCPDPKGKVYFKIEKIKEK